MFWGENTSLELVPHNVESYQVMENFDTENFLDLGIHHIGASGKDQQYHVSSSKTAISQSCIFRKLL